MYNRLIIFGFSSALLLTVSCSSPYRIENIQRTRILVDSTYDASPDKRAEAFISPYKHKVDSVMSPVVGRAARYLSAFRPESPLSDLLADILVWSGKDYNEKPDFAVYNIGGMRAAFAKGDITYGDVLDVAPFENKICFVTLKGRDVTELFGQIAMVGGEAVSHGVELKVSRDFKLVSARLNGKEIDPDADYRIVTLDYVSQGNDKMEAFKKSTDINSPESADNNVRQIITRYMKEKLAAGQSVDAQIEGRIKIEDK